MKGSIGSSTHIVGRAKWNKPGKLCPACNASDKPRGGVLKVKYGKYGRFIACNLCMYTCK